MTKRICIARIPVDRIEEARRASGRASIWVKRLTTDDGQKAAEIWAGQRFNRKLFWRRFHEECRLSTQMGRFSTGLKKPAP